MWLSSTVLSKPFWQNESKQEIELLNHAVKCFEGRGTPVCCLALWLHIPLQPWFVQCSLIQPITNHLPIRKSLFWVRKNCISTSCLTTPDRPTCVMLFKYPSRKIPQSRYVVCSRQRFGMALACSKYPLYFHL